MRRVHDFVDRMVQVVFANGSVTALLEAVAEDGSLFLKQGRTPIWVPLGQVRYVTLLDGPPTEADPDDSLA
jgi:hypothetical protein